MTARFALLGDYVVSYLKSGTWTIGTVEVERTYKHWLEREEIGNAIKVSVAPWDLSRSDLTRGPWQDQMIMSVVVQKAVQWREIGDMDDMSQLVDEMLDWLTVIPAADLGTSPDNIFVQRNPAPSTEPFLIPEEFDKGMFASRIAIQFFTTKGD